MRWPCKVCSAVLLTKGDLLKHYRLQHGTFGHGHSLPCLHIDCPCSFKSWNALRTHVSRYHVEVDSPSPDTALSFKCQVCGRLGFSTEKDYFEHLGHHLKNNETVECVFEGCNHQTNIYGTFAAHKSRKHTPHSLRNFKAAVLSARQVGQQNEGLINFEVPGEEDNNDDSGEGTSSGVECHQEQEDPNNTIVEHLASFFLKLESVHNVSNRCIAELV